MAFQVPTVFTAIDRITAPFRGMTAAVQGFALKAQTAIHRVDRAMLGLSRRINAVTGGFGILLGATLAFTTAQAAVRTMTDFELGLVTVGKRAQISGKELSDFGNSVIAASREMRAVVGTDKLLEMAGAAAALGVKGTDNLLKFGVTLAKLETATNIVGEEGAASIARILNVTGEGVKVVDQFGAAIVALGNNSAATETEILEVANEVSRATSPFKLGAAAVLGISASLRSVGVQAQAGGSGVGRFFKQLEEATFTGKNLSNFAKILNLTEDQITKQFKEDAAGLFVPFVRGLQRVSKEGGSVNAALKSVGINGEIAFKGLAPLASAGDLVARSMELGSKAFKENIALQREFDAASRTIRAGMNSVRNEFNNIINATANSNDGFSVLSQTLFFVSKHLKTIITTATILVGVYVTLKTTMFVLTVATTAYNFVLAITNVLQGKSIFVLKRSVAALGVYKFAVKGATAAQRLFNLILRANPIGLIITLILGLGTAMAVLTNHWDTWGAAVALSMGPLGLLLSTMQSLERNWTRITEAFTRGGIIDGLKAIGLVLLDAILMPLEQATRLIEKFTGLDLGVRETELARNMALRRLDLLAGITPPPVPSPAPAVGPIGVAAPPEPLDINALQRQLFNDQLATTVNTQGKVEIAVKDDMGRLNVDTTGLTDNVNVQVMQGFTFSDQQ